MYISSVCIREQVCYNFYITGLYDLYLNKIAERDLREKFLPTNGVVFDVGARIGTWTLPSIALRNITYSFEPVYESMMQLENNISLNGYGSYSQVIDVAVSDIDGYKRFHHHASHPSRDAISEVGESNIRTVTLDSFVKDNHVARIDFIKIDAEGEEVAVIEGAVDVIRTMLPDMIIENHDDYKMDQLLMRVHEIAGDSGYKSITNIPSSTYAVDRRSHTIFLS